MKRKRNGISSNDWAELYAKYINNDMGTEEFLEENVHQYITTISRANGGAPGFFLPCIFVGINFELSLCRAMVRVDGTYHSNLNSYWVAIGQATQGKHLL